jgi:Carboxypeptidase regulatory-like domain/Putative zinc-finger
MSDHLQPGIHPDADLLGAFMEGVLPEPEREACLAHLAECASCREIVYAAQEPTVEPTTAAVPSRKRLWIPVSLLSAGAVTVILTVVVMREFRPARVAPLPQLSTQNSAPAETAPAAPRQGPGEAETPAPPSASPAVKKPTPRSAPVLPPPAPAPAPVAEPALAAAPPSLPTATAPPVAPSTLLPPQPVTVEARSAIVNVEQSSGVSGTVTDATGVAIPTASVTIRPGTGGTAMTARTNNAGQFSFVPLPPGRYQVLVTAPGFQTNSQEVEVKSQVIAQANSKLSVGSVAETVVVEAQAPGIQTEAQTLPLNGRVAKAITPAPLPSKLDSASTAQKNKTILSVDRDGRLYLSTNSGKSWKAVKPVWQDKVIRLVTPPDAGSPAKTVFQLTTDSGAIWFSRNGKSWTQH